MKLYTKKEHIDNISNMLKAISSYGEVENKCPALKCDEKGNFYRLPNSCKICHEFVNLLPITDSDCPCKKWGYDEAIVRTILALGREGLVIK